MNNLMKKLNNFKLLILNNNNLRKQLHLAKFKNNLAHQKDSPNFNKIKIVLLYKETLCLIQKRKKTQN